MQLSNETNEKKIPSNPSCGYCDFGLVMATMKHQSSLPYAFLCSCPIGHRRLEKYARWSTDMKINFEIIEPASQSWNKKGPVAT